MPREAKLDEPLVVQPPRHPLQYRDAARVVLDQVVIGGQDGGDAALGGEGRYLQRNIRKGGLVYDGSSYSPCKPLNLIGIVS